MAPVAWYPSYERSDTHRAKILDESDLTLGCLRLIKDLISERHICGDKYGAATQHLGTYCTRAPGHPDRHIAHWIGEKDGCLPPIRLWRNRDDDTTDPIRLDPNYPHVCPNCKGPAYIGATTVDCKGKCR